jgi:uncharacterized membrane protein YczE
MTPAKHQLAERIQAFVIGAFCGAVLSLLATWALDFKSTKGAVIIVGIFALCFGLLASFASDKIEKVTE